MLPETLVAKASAIEPVSQYCYVAAFAAAKQSYGPFPSQSG